MREVGARAGVVLACALTACGGSQGSSGGGGEIGKTSDQIIKDVAAAVAGTHAYHLSGKVDQGGDSVGFDLRISGPTTLKGSLTLKGATAKLVVIGDAAYVQGKKFFAVFGNPQAADLFGERWVKLPASTSAELESAFGPFTDTTKLSHCLLGATSGTSLSKSTSTVDGTAAIALSGGGSTLDVAASGPPYPLRITGTGGAGLGTKSSDPACSPTASSSSSTSSSSSGSSGTVRFDSWGASTSVTPPPDALDLSSLSPSG